MVLTKEKDLVLLQEVATDGVMHQGGSELEWVGKYSAGVDGR